MDKTATELPSADRETELRELGFVTALQTAGIPEDKITSLYDTYREQDAARYQTMETVYNTIVGKAEASE